MRACTRYESAHDKGSRESIRRQPVAPYMTCGENNDPWHHLDACRVATKGAGLRRQGTREGLLLLYKPRGLNCQLQTVPEGLMMLSP